MYLKLEYFGYSWQTRSSRFPVCRITVKVNFKLHSQYRYLKFFVPVQQLRLVLMGRLPVWLKLTIRSHIESDRDFAMTILFILDPHSIDHDNACQLCLKRKYVKLYVVCLCFLKMNALSLRFMQHIDAFILINVKYVFSLKSPCI